MNETTRKTIKAAFITAALSATVFASVGLAVAGTPQASGEPSPITKAFNAGKAAIQGIFAPAKTRGGSSSARHFGTMAATAAALSHSMKPASRPNF